MEWEGPHWYYLPEHGCCCRHLLTCASATELQVPNQSTTQRLKRAGDVVQRLSKSAPAGFMVKTTWRLRCTSLVKRRKRSSSLSVMAPALTTDTQQIREERRG